MNLKYLLLLSCFYSIVLFADELLKLPKYPIPFPDTDTIEPTVKETLDFARQVMRDRLQNPKLSKQQFAQAYGELASIYHVHHLYIPAQASYLNAISLDDDNMRWHYYLGYLYQQTSRPQLAKQQYQQALILKPDYLPLKLRLAELYLQLNQAALAQQLLNPQTMTDTDINSLSSYHLYLFAKLALKNKNPNAINYLGKALAKSPNATRLHYHLAMAYRFNHNIKQAQWHLKQRGEGLPTLADPILAELEKLLTGSRTHFYRAIEAIRVKHYDIAKTSFAEGLKIQPENINARISYARTLYLTGEKTQAQQQLEFILQQQPKNDFAHFLLAALLEEQNQISEAIHHYHLALQANPKHAGAHYYLAHILMRQGKYQQAADHYAQSLHKQADNPPAYIYYLIALHQSNADYQTIQSVLRQAQEHYPDNQTFQYLMARIYATHAKASLTDKKKALILAKQLYQTSPLLENAETLAMAYAQLGQYEQAIKLQQQALEATFNAQRYDLIARLEANLKRYQRRQATRQTWDVTDIWRQAPFSEISSIFQDYPSFTAY